MLRGRFGDTTGRPFIEGNVHLTRIGVRFDVSFLVDTGADSTLNTPIEGMRMGIDYSQLTPRSRPFEGIGGAVYGFEELAVVSFLDRGKLLRNYVISVGITPPRRRRGVPHPEDIVALLGRDILCNWSVSLSQRSGRAQFKVLSSDFDAPVPG